MTFFVLAWLGFIKKKFAIANPDVFLFLIFVKKYRCRHGGQRKHQQNQYEKDSISYLGAWHAYTPYTDNRDRPLLT